MSVWGFPDKIYGDVLRLVEKGFINSSLKTIKNHSKITQKSPQVLKHALKGENGLLGPSK